MKFHSDKNNIILDPRGAKWFLKKLSSERWQTVDTVIDDPPWYNDDDSDDIEKVNMRSRFKDPKVNWQKQYTRIMKREDRDEINSIIKNNIGENTRIIHHHSTRGKLPILDSLCCEHVWIKPINITLSGNCDRNNGEILLIEGSKIKGKVKGRVLDKYIYNCPPQMRIHNGVSKLVRACSKPHKLYSELYRHLNSKHILDPFAGYGTTISAALEMGIKIDACDMDVADLQNQWKNYTSYITLEQTFMYE